MSGATADAAVGGATPVHGFFGHPRGLATLFFTEMWERMSFYGMRGLLIHYLVDSVHGLGLDDRTAAAIYGLYVGGTYLACLPGGWVGDRWLGSQRSVLVGAVIIAIGHLLLGTAATHSLFFVGLLVIVTGTGLLKPNASALVAGLYPHNSPKLDSAYTLYYVGINVGGTLGPLVAGSLADRFGWSAGFMAAAAGMAIGVVQFLWGRHKLGEAGAKPAVAPTRMTRRIAWGAAALVLIVMLASGAGAIPLQPLALQSISTALIIAVAALFFIYLLFFAGLTAAERRRVYVVMVLFAASVLFWAGYEQSGSSLNLFAARYTDRGLFGWSVPTVWLQALEPAFILIFGGVLSAVWLWLGKRGRDPSWSVKFILGLLFMGLGFVVMAAAARRLLITGHAVGMQWLTLTFLLHTFGELCLSPMGLSACSQLVPRRFVSQSLGVWFASLALGELLAGRIAGNLGSIEISRMPQQFLAIFWYAAVCAAGVAAMLPLLRRWSAGR